MTHCANKYAKEKEKEEKKNTKYHRELLITNGQLFTEQYVDSDLYHRMIFHF